jgi:hypothetical protein
MRDVKAAVHVTPPLSERRLERQWERISTRLEKGRLISWPVAAMATVAGAIAIALVVFSQRPATVASNPFSVASLAEGRQELAFSDGSRVTVAPGGRLRVERATAVEVAIQLVAGRARDAVRGDARGRCAARRRSARGGGRSRAARSGSPRAAAAQRRRIVVEPSTGRGTRGRRGDERIGCSCGRRGTGA